jgi:hypothetical protein
MIFGKFDERGQTGMAKPETRPPDLRKSNPQPAAPEQHHQPAAQAPATENEEHQS